MKFKIDENLPVEVAILLKDSGYDAHTVHDEGMTGANDDKINSRCKSEDRILITLDLDFSDIRNYPPESNPGIIVIRTVKQDKKFILQIISELIFVIKTEPVQQKLWIVEEDKIRVR
jgi:predicted nuclease of predicted toxin-antitoxin system